MTYTIDGDITDMPDPPAAPLFTSFGRALIHGAGSLELDHPGVPLAVGRGARLRTVRPCNLPPVGPGPPPPVPRGRSPARTLSSCRNRALRITLAIHLLLGESRMEMFHRPLHEPV